MKSEPKTLPHPAHRPAVPFGICAQHGQRRVRVHGWVRRAGHLEGWRGHLGQWMLAYVAQLGGGGGGVL